MCRLIGVGLVTAFIIAGNGCDRIGTDEQAGGPGVDIRADDDQEPQEPERIFTASLEEDSLQLPVGKQKTLTLSIERGDKFKQSVVALVKPPGGILADPEELNFALGQQEGLVVLAAISRSLVGDELAVEIEFRPESGKSVRKQLLVTVTEAEESNE